MLNTVQKTTIACENTQESPQISLNSDFPTPFYNIICGKRYSKFDQNRVFLLAFHYKKVLSGEVCHGDS